MLTAKKNDHSTNGRIHKHTNEAKSDSGIDNPMLTFVSMTCNRGFRGLPLGVN